MSGPEFEGVLAAHEAMAGGLFCRCQPEDEDGARDVLPEFHDAHLSAALHAELVRWLGDEGTREVVARAVMAHVCNVSNLPDWMQVSALGRDMRPLADPIINAALAALTTTDQEDR